MKKQFIILSAAMTALPLLINTANAQTVTTKEVTQQAPPPPGSSPIDLSAFDMNSDTILSSTEVGEMLFKLYDTDADGVLNKREYENRTILTVVPMEKQTTITYDFDNDGVADKSQSTFQTFTQETQLARFGDNPAGLSPREFIDKTFSLVDMNDSAGVDRAEWKSAYTFKIAPVPVK